MTDEIITKPEEVPETEQLPKQDGASVLFNSSQTVDSVITHHEDDVSETTRDVPQLPDPLQTPGIAAPIPHPELTEASSQSVPTSPAKGKRISPVLQIAFYGVLFVVGIAVGLGVRQVILSVPGKNTPKLTPTAMPTATYMQTPTPISTTWNIQSVFSGKTRQPLTGITFRLPQSVLPLTCDGEACASQGTYLPGGTRFTVALRGVGQVLPDFRGAEIVDVGGIPFVTTQIGLGTRTGIAFRGEFPGTTVGGYTFSEMRGVMIPLTTGLSLEVNHFAPRGVTTNFITDDSLFDQIIQTFDISDVQYSTTAAQLPQVTVTPGINASGTATITPTP